MNRLKKVFLALTIGTCLVITAWSFGHADDKLCTNWGTFTVCVPIASGIDAAYGYDFRNHEGQGLAETPVVKLSIAQNSQIVFKVGGVTSDNGKGAPFGGADYELKSVINPISSLITVMPGVYGGRDFTLNRDFWGLKASVVLVY